MANPLSKKELDLIDAYWRAANYLSVGQIYLYDNPLLKKALTKEHIKPRLLGHWGTTPGLNFLYAHLNRMIKSHDLNMIYITGPGHGGPGLVANAYLEGTYSEVYPNIPQDEDGLKRLFKQFSFPGGIPSHVAPETPGSIHEGGELGYAVSHAYGAAFDNPDLIVACVVGDGEAETGPLATSWHSNKFLNPVTDGVVLPILHLNGYKIANPCVLARISHEELDHLFRGYGYTPYFVEGNDPAKMHQLMAETLDIVVKEIQSIKADARKNGFKKRPLWPMIVFRTPKGWTCPKEIDGKRTEDYWRSHQVPMGEMHENPAHVRLLEKWMKSYKPEELFDKDGRLKPELADLPPKGERRMSANPHANGGLLLKNLRMPEFRDYAIQVVRNAHALAESLVKGGVDIVTGGTDNHLMLVDLRPKGVTGRDTEQSLERAFITCNKNAIPFDPQKPAITSGVRVGTPAATSRGFGEAEFTQVGELIVEVLDGLAANGPDNNGAVEDAVRAKVRALTDRFPIYPNR